MLDLLIWQVVPNNKEVEDNTVLMAKSFYIFCSNAQFKEYNFLHTQFWMTMVLYPTLAQCLHISRPSALFAILFHCSCLY